MVDYWREWVKNPPASQNFLVIDAGENDWRENGPDGGKIVAQIKAKLNELGFTP